ncbi:hypothetical protein [Acidianus brierleyi]|uniref:DUF8155 domain-containing protein n=1 Tax=Acidianus brierleyi TaxID=41673 RepID=A0A2U9IHE3_9CREN|nr:hypothetical protein [Acidianus brierleyi]AWR95344.1 hypothetical protein DFR85_12805 [Acidianus brierleyi]
MLVSYFSSGFPSHVRIKALDISSCREYFYSPFDGEIFHIEKFFVGRPNKFSKVNYDYLILAKVKNKIIKILHVEPFLNEGDKINKGEIIGKFLENPYTGGDFLHAHIEGIKISFPKITNYDERGIGVIVNVYESYFDVKLKTYSSAGNLRGLGCCGGLLNASLPYSGYGGIIGKEVSHVKIGNTIFHIAKRRRNLTLFEIKKGLIRNWEYESTFKVLEGSPIFIGPLFEAILSYKGFPLIRFFFKTNLSIGDEIDVWKTISSMWTRSFTLW